MTWQEAVAIAMGAVRCSPTERKRAFRLLHDTGIAGKLGGKIADATRAMMEDEGEETETVDRNEPRGKGRVSPRILRGREREGKSR